MSDKLRFTIEDREYTFKESWTVEDAKFLKKESGATVANVIDYLDRRDPETVQTVVFLHKRANNEVVRFNDLLDLNIASFRWLLPNTERCEACSGRGTVPTERADEEPEETTEEADPTKASGTTRKKGTSKTG